MFSIVTARDPDTDEMRLATVERRVVSELVRELDTLGSFAEPVLERVTAELARLWDEQRTFAYDWCIDGGGLHIDRTFGTDPRFQKAMQHWVPDAPSGWAFYNPLRPDARQRDRAVRLCDLGLRLNPWFMTFYERWGTAEDDQLRALICDGPIVLAWVGALRRRAFTTRDRAVLAALVPALKRRLLLERRLGHSQLDAAVALAALDAIAAPAFVVSATARVVYANGPARSLLDGRRAETLEWLGRARRGEGDDASRVELTIPGLPPHYLITRVAPVDDPTPRVVRAAARWQLTGRQAQVLALVARGAPNKSIAAELGMAESTVEIHVTALLRKADAENRAALVARFWTETA